ncbi:MAG: FAD-dependent monooxygenase [Vicinamibacterales bacterium]
MATPSRRAVVVGAGIGGLAAALALRRAGWTVRVYERAVHPRELGFALLLAPNAMRALRAIGLADAAIAGGFIARSGEMRRPNGDVLRQLDVGSVRDVLGEDSVCLLRPVLHGALLDAVGMDALELGCEASGVEARPGGAALVLADGRAIEADVVIGADGVGSAVRRSLHPQEPPPRATGLAAIRGVALDVGHVLGDLSGLQYFGRGVEAGVARASERATYWYMSVLARPVRDAADEEGLLARALEPFHAPFRQIVAATAAPDLRVDTLFDRDPTDQWGRGAVTLLGDAAHPMLPHAGQGAAQALEDAVRLARELAGDGDPAEALRRYERIRQTRTRAIVLLARRNARMASLRSPLACWLRDAAIRLVPDRVILGSLIAMNKAPEDPA